MKNPFVMTDFPTDPEEETTMKLENRCWKRRLCDYCNEKTALLYCRADSARLCLSCDREVHSANQLFSKHSRSQLCDACDASPASIFCQTEQSVLCQNCDWESHKSSECSLHSRRPIEGFTGCPSVNELMNIIGFEDLGNKALALSEKTSDSGDGLLDVFALEATNVSSLDYFIVSSDFGHGLRATDVPLLPKNRNAVCGQHKEEILHQLRELAKSEPSLSNEKTDNDFQYLTAGENLQLESIYTSFTDKAEPVSFPSYESNASKWLNENIEVPDQVCFPSSLLSGCTQDSNVVIGKYLDSGWTVSHADNDCTEQPQRPVAPETSLPLPRVTPHELNSQERETAISRYKEKRKTRRYDKHIRYESRKLRAENRVRVRGRFAKVEH